MEKKLLKNIFPQRQNNIFGGAIINLRILIIMPIVTYVISYLYLAYYHGKILVFNTIVHEGGTYTLLQDIFYASHFLGHIPVHTMIAFLFIGSYLCLSGFNSNTYLNKKIEILRDRKSCPKVNFCKRREAEHTVSSCIALF